MSLAALIRKMADAGATPEVIALAVEAVEAEQAKEADRREKRAAQKRKERDRRATVARHGSDNAATVASTSQNVASAPCASKDNHARAPVCSNGSSLRSEPELINPLPSEGPLKPKSRKSTNTTPERSVREILSECLSEQSADDLIAHRKAKRAPMTAGAARALVKALRAYGDPERGVQEMLARGWTGFKPDWMHEARAGPVRHERHDGLATVYRQLIESEKDEQATENKILDGNVLRIPVVPNADRPDSDDSGGVFAIDRRLSSRNS